MPPRLLATSPYRLLACGCSSPWAASAGARPPPQTTEGQVDRARALVAVGLVAAAFCGWGGGGAHPPKRPRARSSRKPEGEKARWREGEEAWMVVVVVVVAISG